MGAFKNQIQKFQNAFHGIWIFIRTAEHAKWHLTVAAIVIIAGWYFCVSNVEWLIVILCIGFVLVAEAINESIERICDFMHKDLHPDIGKIKDIAAGAVLIAAITAVVIGAIIFLPKILERLEYL